MAPRPARLRRYGASPRARRRCHLRRSACAASDRRAQAAGRDAEQNAITAVSASVTRTKGRSTARIISRLACRNAAFVEHGNAECLGLRELAPGIGAGHDVVGLLADRTGHFSAARLRSLRSPPRATSSGAYRSGRMSCRSAGPALTRLSSARSIFRPAAASSLDQRLVLRLVEILPHRPRPRRGRCRTRPEAALLTRSSARPSCRTRRPAPARPARRRGGCQDRRPAARNRRVLLRSICGDADWRQTSSAIRSTRSSCSCVSL